MNQRIKQLSNTEKITKQIENLLQKRRTKINEFIQKGYRFPSHYLRHIDELDKTSNGNIRSQYSPEQRLYTKKLLQKSRMMRYAIQPTEQHHEKEASKQYEQ